jgi:hypothetical protein
LVRNRSLSKAELLMTVLKARQVRCEPDQHALQLCCALRLTLRTRSWCPSPHQSGSISICSSTGSERNEVISRVARRLGTAAVARCEGPRALSRLRLHDRCMNARNAPRSRQEGGRRLRCCWLVRVCSSATRMCAQKSAAARKRQQMGKRQSREGCGGGKARWLRCA